MKVLAGSVVIGTIVALAIIYWLRPLNSGAVALVVVLSIGIVALLGRVFAIGGDKKGDPK
jgi:hypothetical protein